MSKHVVIIGGGLAGLSAGCYALSSGYRVTILEHNLALGGVCTAWKRGDYVIDGCIHWLTGGPFAALYRELGVLPKVKLRPLRHFATYRHVALGIEIAVTSDLQKLATDLVRVAPEDEVELRRMCSTAREMAALDPNVGEAPELMTLKESFARLWEMRDHMGMLVHYRKPVGTWVRDHLHHETARRFVLSLLPEEAPMLFFLFLLGYLEQGFLSRPIGGTTSFRDALIESYEKLGGESVLHTTVEEIVVDAGKTKGVRLADGRMVDADVVISTASAPETVLRLLGGRFDAESTQRRLQEWKLFDPIVLVTFGVRTSFEGVPSLLLVDGIEPFNIGDVQNRRLYLRVYNDDPSFAPAGHTVVQAMLTTSYDWWAKQGTSYSSERDKVVEIAKAQLAARLPGFEGNVVLTDVSTPLTFWNMARSWRGAYEGWMPRSGSMFGHVKKKLHGLDGLYLAGQWVEPGGGVPMAIMSGRQAVQLLCEEEGRTLMPPIG